MLPNLSLRRLALLRFALPLLTLLVGVLHTTTASADRGVIKFPGRHPDYSFDAEPHVVLGLFDYGPGDDGFGLGFRGTIPIVDNGFISSINNSVGIGFGLDWLHYENDRCYYRGRNDLYCPDDDYEFDVLVFPVVLQWNFWLSENWSVYGEPGLTIEMYDDDYFEEEIDIDPAFYVGGRFLINQDVALMLRLGHPTFSFGVSFLL